MRPPCARPINKQCRQRPLHLLRRHGVGQCERGLRNRGCRDGCLKLTVGACSSWTAFPASERSKGGNYGSDFLVAANVVRPTDNNQPIFSRTRNSKAFGLSALRTRCSGALVTYWCTRNTRTRWRIPHPGRFARPTSGLHPSGRYGRRLFHGACAERLLSIHEWWSAGNSILLRVPLLRLRGWGRMECR